MMWRGRNRGGAWGLLAVCCLWAAPVAGQGLLVVEATGSRVRLPRPIPQPTPARQSYQIKELSLQGRVTGQVAQVQVSQTFVNTGSETLEAAFLFPLPYDGAVDQLTLLIDGREFAAKLYPADEARRLYEDIVSKNRDPALLEWLGTGLFKTSVFPLPPGAERKVTLRYTQLCRQYGGLTDFLFPLSTAKYTSGPPQKVHFELALESLTPIKNVYSPTHAVTIERPDPSRARVRYVSENQVPTDDFRLFYDVGAGPLGTSLLTYRPAADDDGYFLLLAHPQLPAADAAPGPKTVVAVVDRSGSMSGEKIEQAKGALRFVINNLRPGDLFNIVAYDSVVELFRPELQSLSEETRRQALAFADGLFAGGSTNIDAALTTALGLLQDASRPNYVLFLTDGLPTEGETSEAQIVARAGAANDVRARVLAFGVGFDVNSRLLDRLARDNHGQSEYVRPNEDIEAHVSRLARRIEAPVLCDVKLAWHVEGSGEGGPVNRLYPREFTDLFAGEQLVLVGRYRASGSGRLVVTGQVAGQEQSFEFPLEFAAAGSDASGAFIEKLWATRRVGEILDQLDLKGRNEELVQELVELATRHGILTPYTSFLADESTDLNAVAENAATADERLGRFDQTSGADAFLARRQKQAYQYAGGGAGNGPSSAAEMPALRSGAVGARDEADNVVQVTTVQNVAHKTFYRRRGQWVDSTATEAIEQNAIRVAQFSRDYFDLAAKHGRDLAPYLVFDEPVLVNLAGQGYLIEPAVE